MAGVSVKNADFTTGGHPPLADAAMLQRTAAAVVQVLRLGPMLY
jgi:hypothetical protein